MTSTTSAPETRLDDCLSVRDGHLFVEGVDVVELAATYGTPLHVLSADQLRRRLRRLRRAFARCWPEGPVGLLPSVKANFTLAAWQVLAGEGAGADVFGHHELRFALAAGVAPERISLNGPKHPAAIREAVRVGARVTLDAITELGPVADAARAEGRPARVRLRARPDLAALTQPTDYAPEPVPVSRVHQVYKAGIPLDDLLALDPRALDPAHLDLTGLHFHVGRHLPTLAFWAEVASACGRMVGELHDAWGGWAPAELDLGGGLPSPRDPFGKAIPRVRERGDAVAPYEDYARVITASLREALAEAGVATAGVRLELEPGRATFGDAGIHVARVLGVKRQRRPERLTWVQTDTSETFLPDSTLDHYMWSFVVANRAEAAPVETADLVGMACSMDRLVGDARVPDVGEGDLVAFLDTGAYQDAVSCNRNLLGRPATVLVGGDRARVVKRAETLEDVLARDLAAGAAGEVGEAGAP
jgi:diaminopimelate decarboxylase